MAISRRQVVAGAGALAAGIAFRAGAHGDGKAGHGAKSSAPPEQQPFGIAGDPKRATRTIDIAMTDDMRFHPARIEVRLNETVRFRVRNRGKLMHELVIGTPAELEKHAELMRKHPGMEHDEPHMLHVAPGKSGEMAWRFNRAGSFKYACLIAGHYEAGMVGTIEVRQEAKG
jgi:uncharacterized cupredoxin-like copper-binding protein